MTAFLIWWLHDASLGEYLAVAWLLDVAISIFLVSAIAVFYVLREWFETRPHRRK